MGTTFSFTVNEPAHVSLTFGQQLAGRKVNGRCVARSQRNNGRPKCKRIVTQGSLSLAAQPGVNKEPFQGHISGKKLPPGAYTLMITATGNNGRRSAASSLSFAILP